MQFAIEHTYQASVLDYIELEDVSSFSEIKEWFIRYGTFYYTLDGETWKEVKMGSDTSDVIDWKRPMDSAVFSVEDGAIDEELARQ